MPTPPRSRNTAPSPRRARSRNEAGAARRREDILRCAVRHFARVGYQNADLDGVAAELGCAKGTLYLYFPSKRDLFAAATDMIAAEMIARTQAGAPDADPLQRVEHAVREFLAFFDEHPEYIELIVQERVELRDRPASSYFRYKQSRDEPWRALFRRLMREGRVRRMPADRPLQVIGDVLYGAIFTNYFSGRRRRLSDQAADILDVLLHGLLTPTEAARRARTATPSRRPAARAPAPRRRERSQRKGAPRRGRGG